MKVDGTIIRNTQEYNQTAPQQPQPIEQVEIQSQPSLKTEAGYTISEKLKDSDYVPNVAEKALMNAIAAANKKLEGISTEFQFSVHESTKQIMVKVLNKETGELIREIPSEKVLDMVSKMWEMSGIFVDERR